MSPLWRSQIGELYFDSVKINEIYVYYKRERGKFPADENSVLVAKRTHTKL